MRSYENDILERVAKFVVDVIEFTRTFKKDPAGYSVSKQLIDSSGSIGANIVEARNARIRKEFASSLGISFKEAKETKYWLEIVDKSKLGEGNKNAVLYEECEEICKILGKSVGKLKSKIE
jgi:four helix bundle protein